MPRHPLSSVVPTTRPRALRAVASACAAAIIALGVAEARAQSPVSAAWSTPRSYTLAAQPLGQALNTLARQAGVPVSVNAALVGNKSAAALSGTMSLHQALDRLLAGSGLRAQQEGGAVVIRAAAPSGQPPPRVLDEVLVVGELPRLGTFRARGEAGPVEPGVVSARTVERRVVNDLEDLFAGQPEMGVGGGHGIAQKIYLRGIEDTLLNVTVDGATQPGQTFHHTGRVQLEPELLRRVEVRSGTGDAGAGPGALGGVLRFVTKDPEDLLRKGEQAGALVKAGYFSNAEGFKLHTRVYGRFSDTWSAMAAVTNQRMKDYEDGSGQRVANTGARQQLGFLKLVGRPAAGHSLRLSYDTHIDTGQRTQRPQWITSGFNRAYPLRSVRGTWNLGYAWQPADASADLAFNLFQTDTTLEQNVVDRWGRYQGRIRSGGLELRNTSHLGAHELSYGVDHRKDHITAGPAAAPRSEREHGTVSGLFVQDHITLSPDLSMGIGARWDRYRLNDTNGLAFNHGGVSPNVSVRYAATPALSLLAGHARALRGPKIRDAFKLDTITNDPQLRPEKADTSEGGFEYAQGAWRLNGKAYLTRIRDAVSDPIGRPVRNQNVGELQSRGVLLHSGYDWAQIRVGAAFHHNRVTLKGQRLNVYEHNGLGTSPGNTLTGSVDWRVAPGLDIGWMGRFVQGIGTLDTAVGRVRKPGYAVHDIYANWRPTGRDDLIVSVAVHNLFNQNYLDHASNEDFQSIPGYEGIVGSREPGRELRLNLSLRF